MDPRLNSLTTEKLLSSLADFLMPRVCLVCGRQLLVQERHLCLECMADLPLTHYWGLARNPMADKISSLLPESPVYVRAASLFFYSDESGYGSITRSLKYGRNFGAGRFFSRMLGRRMAESGIWSDVDIVCPVPLHPFRRFRRGYNQAAVIGRELARELGARFEPHLLRRVRRTRSQTSLTQGERAANVAGAFAVHRSFRKMVSAGQGHPLRILIVDDVFTTGATLSACCRALLGPLGDRVCVCTATLGYVE